MRDCVVFEEAGEIIATNVTITALKEAPFSFFEPWDRINYKENEQSNELQNKKNELEKKSKKY